MLGVLVFLPLVTYLFPICALRVALAFFLVSRCPSALFTLSAAPPTIRRLVSIPFLPRKWAFLRYFSGRNLFRALRAPHFPSCFPFFGLFAPEAFFLRERSPFFFVSPSRVHFWSAHSLLGQFLFSRLVMLCVSFDTRDRFFPDFPGYFPQNSAILSAAPFFPLF